MLLVKYSPYGECDVFPTANSLIILKMPSRESREGIRIRDRISISYNNGRRFAFGEDSHTLRLASELADLRAANANRRRLRGSVRIVAIPAKTKATLARGFCLGWDGRIRTDECGSQSPVPYRLATSHCGPEARKCFGNSIVYKCQLLTLKFSSTEGVPFSEEFTTEIKVFPRLMVSFSPPIPEITSSAVSFARLQRIGTYLPSET